MSLHFSAFFFISLQFFAFLCISLHSFAFKVLYFRTSWRSVLSCYGRHFYSGPRPTYFKLIWAGWELIETSFSDAPASLALMIVTDWLTSSLLENRNWLFRMFDSSHHPSRIISGGDVCLVTLVCLVGLGTPDGLVSLEGLVTLVAPVCVRRSLRCCRIWSAVEVQFSYLF